MTPFEWLKNHGGTGVFAKTKRAFIEDEDGDVLVDYKGRGRVFIAAGETANFSPASILMLVKKGKAVRDGHRITIKEGILS